MAATPYEMGWDAAERGKSLGACPFHAQSGEAIAWRAGMRDFWNSYGNAEARIVAALTIV